MENQSCALPGDWAISNGHEYLKYVFGENQCEYNKGTGLSVRGRFVANSIIDRNLDPYAVAHCCRYS